MGGFRQPGGQSLDRDVPAQSRVLGEEDLAHSSAPQLTEQAVGTDRAKGFGLRGHGWIEMSYHGLL
jgi:hypothetical protein